MLDKRYILWVDCGYDGWTPYGYDTLEDCLKHDRYGRDFIITSGKIEFEVLQKYD